MPRGDRTGPQGQGSRTGRGMGPCGAENKQDPIPGQGQTLRKRVMTGLGNAFRLGRNRGQGSQGQGQGRKDQRRKNRNK